MKVLSDHSHVVLHTDSRRPWSARTCFNKAYLYCQMESLVNASWKLGLLAVVFTRPCMNWFVMTCVHFGWEVCMQVNTSWVTVIKQLLDEVFVLSRYRRLRLITLTETFIILNITKTESNNCFIIHWMKKKLNSCFCFFTDGKNTKRANLTWLPLEIMHRSHKWHDYPWPWVSLTWLLYNLQVMTSQVLISKIHCTLLANQKRVREFNV